MTTAVAERPKQQITLRDKLASPSVIAEIGKAMPSHCKPERMARIAITALTRTPGLMKCSEASFFDCLIALSQWGLEPDGQRAHLIPYGNKCTLIIDYKGYVELAYRSGIVQNIHADIVRTGDIFKYSRGKLIDHVPWYLRDDANKPEKAGDVYAAYCLVELKGGTEKCEVLSREDVEAIRKRSKSGGSGPWTTDWNEMAKKSAFRRVSKWLPLSAEVADAMDADADKLETLPPVSGNGHSGSMDEIATTLLNQSEQPEQGETIDEAAPEDIDQSEPDAEPSSISESAWADFQAALAECSDKAEVDKTLEMMLKLTTDPADISKLKNHAEMRMVVIKGKRGQRSNQQSFVEPGESAQ